MADSGGHVIGWQTVVSVVVPFAALVAWYLQDRAAIFDDMDTGDRIVMEQLKQSEGIARDFIVQQNELYKQDARRFADITAELRQQIAVLDNRMTAAELDFRETRQYASDFSVRLGVLENTVGLRVLRPPGGKSSPGGYDDRIFGPRGRVLVINQ